MAKLMDIRPEYMDIIPEKLEDGVLYISKKYGIAMHNCACGCGEKTATPLEVGECNKDRKEWKLIEAGPVVSLTPSVGNFSGQRPYHAHYYITENKIVWV